MPAPGDQHGSVTSNPFDEPRLRINEYTAQEIATLQSRLEKQLGPEYISARPGASGTKVHYLAAEKCINLANEVFGFNGWSSSIKEIQVDFVEENAQTGKINLGLSVVVRVTLRDGTFHEDIGYGHIENCKGKAAAFEKAKKEGTTDALKRALRNFGNVLGNCIYDKQYLARVTKMRVATARWTEARLHRHPDYMPLPREEPEEMLPNPSAEPLEAGEALEDLDEFGSEDFIEMDISHHDGAHPDEVALDDSMTVGPQSRRPHTQRASTDIGVTTVRSTNASANPSAPAEAARSLRIPALRAPSVPPNPNTPLPSAAPQTPQATAPARSAMTAIPGNPSVSATNSVQASVGVGDATAIVPQAVPHDVPTAFVSARAAEKLQTAPSAAVSEARNAFNPHVESPSIRKTAGVDHTSSKPMLRSAAKGSASSATPAAPQTNFVNPQLDQTRKIGMPAAAQPSPRAMRSAYRMPGMMKRPADVMLAGSSTRAPLGDSTSAALNVPVQSNTDAKRARVDEGVGPPASAGVAT